MCVTIVSISVCTQSEPKCLNLGVENLRLDKLKPKRDVGGFVSAAQGQSAGKASLLPLGVACVLTLDQQHCRKE